MAPAVASAQSAVAPYEDRGYIQVTAGAQSGSHLITSSSSFSIYDETATIDGSQAYGGGAIWGIGGGARVWRNLVVSLNYARYGDDMETAVVARVPHPLFLNRPREATQNLPGLKHTENQYHLTASWMFPFGDDLVLGVGAGPSFVGLSHEFPSGGRPVEQGAPPDFATVSLQDVTFTRGEKTATTANFGADLTYKLPFDVGQAGKLGATVGFRYAGGTADLQGPNGSVGVKYGGAQFHGGLRLSF